MTAGARPRNRHAGYNTRFANPYRPGAGHMPPYLAGRESPKAEFRDLLDQDPITRNLILTGVRGVGKSVLLDTLKPIGLEEDWVWVGTDFSESATVTEHTLALRLLTDVSVVTSGIKMTSRPGVGFASPGRDARLSFEALMKIYTETPGLVIDRIKETLEVAAKAVNASGKRGLIFAYDEAQVIEDSASREEFPIQVLLGLFESMQKRGVPVILVLAGLPSLHPKLHAARTYVERMFHVLTLKALTRTDTVDAICKPLDDARCPVRFDDRSVETIWQESAGYPYFVQFICRDVYDMFMQQADARVPRSVPVEAIVQKLDSDFFAGRWERVTSRQRDLLWVTANLEKSFDTVEPTEIVSASKELLPRPFTASRAGQLLSELVAAGVMYTPARGKYAFSVPLFDRFILRQER